MEYCCHIWVSIPTFNLNTLDKPLGHRVNVTSFSHIYSISSNKYCSSDSHHEWKNKKTTGQIKFLAVAIKQQIKLVLSCNILYVKINLMYWFKCSCCTVSSSAFSALSNHTYQYIITSFNKEPKD